jgi:cell division protein FtsB
MFRLLALVLLVLIVLLQIKLWQGEGSWTAAQELKAQVEQQRAENARLKARNDALSAEVEDLKTGATAVEERARSELGMVKPGETFYRVVEPVDPNANVRPEDVPEDVAHGCTSTATAGCEKAAGAQTPAAQAPKK